VLGLPGLGVGLKKSALCNTHRPCLQVSGLGLRLIPPALASRNLASVTSLGLVLGLSDLGLWHKTMQRVTDEIPQRGGLLLQYTECDM